MTPSPPPLHCHARPLPIHSFSTHPCSLTLGDTPNPGVGLCGTRVLYYPRYPRLPWGEACLPHFTPRFASVFRCLANKESIRLLFGVPEMDSRAAGRSPEVARERKR